MLEDTLVIWGEFGRTPMAQGMDGIIISKGFRFGWLEEVLKEEFPMDLPMN